MREFLQEAHTLVHTGDLDAAAQRLTAALASANLTPSHSSLLLHLRALLEASVADQDSLSATLGQAADIERAAGWLLAAHHSIHQLALLTAPGGSVARLKSYYRETFDNLRRTQNHQGAGLCLRSLGELAWLSPKPEQAVTFWRSGAKSLSRVGAVDSEQLRGWAELAQPDAD